MIPGKYAVIDLETNILNTDTGTNKASPHHEPNGIVVGGVLTSDNPEHVDFFTTSQEFDAAIYDAFRTCQVFVGQNIKFDLLYLRRFFPETYKLWVKRGGQVWDTQVAEYLLSGQTDRMVSLDSLSARYGGTLKPDKIKEYWKAGIDTADIDPAELCDYLKGDVLNTHKVFRAQLKRINDEGMTPLMRTQMDALLALTEIEHNGMFFDYISASNVAGTKTNDLNVLTGIIQSVHMSELMPEVAPNVNSPVHIAALLYGGKLPYDKVITVTDANGLPVKYKSGQRKGQVKTKKVKGKKIIIGHALPPIEHGKSGRPSTSDETLKEHLKDKYLPQDARAFIERILEYRSLKKDLTTYYIGYTALTWPDNCIHANFNMTNTATGRLSSSAPNLQNLTRKDT